MAIDKKLLKRLSILYVEDDSVIRTELSQLLASFFGTVYSAKDGKEGLETYLQNQDTIDIILSDINMPKLNGIEMVKTIREIDKKIPIFFATAYSDVNFLAEAIKLRIYEYIVKPIDIRSLFGIMNDLAAVIYQDSLIKQKSKELKKYKEIIDLNNIVIETDVHMKIVKVNDLFCEKSGYSKEEVIGKDFKFIKHPDFSSEIYTKMYVDLFNNKVWQGSLKNITKDHSTYTTDCHMISLLDDANDVIGILSIQKDITEELNKKRDIQLALMKDKSDIFKRSKEGTAEQFAIINDLKHKLLSIQEENSKSGNNIEKYIYTAEKYTLENRRLKTELATYKKNANRHGLSLKLSKENSDLRLDLKRMTNKLADLKEKSDKKIQQEKVNYEIEIDEINDKLQTITNKYETIETNDVLAQKLEYWKEKSKNESRRVEVLEKQIISHASKDVMNKIFS